MVESEDMTEEDSFAFKKPLEFGEPFKCSKKELEKLMELRWSEILDKAQTMNFETGRPFKTKKGVILALVGLFTLLFYAIVYAFSLLGTVLTTSDKQIIALRPGVTDAGIFLYLFLLGSSLWLAIAILAIVVFVMFIRRLLTRPPDNQIALKHYLARVVSQIEENKGGMAIDEYFKLIIDEDEEDSPETDVKWNIAMKRAKVYWNPVGIFECFYMKTNWVSIFLVSGIWLLLGGLALLASIDPVLDTLGRDQIREVGPKWIHEMGGDVLSSVTPFLPLIGLVLILGSITTSVVYRRLLKELSESLDSYIDRLQARALTNPSSLEELTRLQVFQNIRKEHRELPGHPFGGLVQVAGIVPVVLGVIMWIAQNFL